MFNLHPQRHLKHLPQIRKPTLLRKSGKGREARKSLLHLPTFSCLRNVRVCEFAWVVTAYELQSLLIAYPADTSKHEYFALGKSGKARALHILTSLNPPWSTS